MSKHHDIEYLIDLCQRIMDVLADVRDTNEFEQTTLLCMNLHAAAASLTRRADELAAAKIELVASFTSGRTASNLGIERCVKINGLNSDSETWTGIGVATDFLADMDIIERFYFKITKLPPKDHIVIYYNILGKFKNSQPPLFDRADEAFTMGIQIGRSWRQDKRFDTFMAQELIEGTCEFGVPVVDEIALA
jgi:hypothetical protein